MTDRVVLKGVVASVESARSYLPPLVCSRRPISLLIIAVISIDPKSLLKVFNCICITMLMKFEDRSVQEEVFQVENVLIIVAEGLVLL